MTLPQDALKNEIFKILLEHSHASRTTATEEIAKLFERCATEWAGKVQGKEAWYLKRIKSLRDTLEQILHAPVPANEREYMAWFVTAKNVAGGAISNDDAEVEIAKYKEVGNG